MVRILPPLVAIFQESPANLLRTEFLLVARLMRHSPLSFLNNFVKKLFLVSILLGSIESFTAIPQSSEVQGVHVQVIFVCKLLVEVRIFPLQSLLL